MTDTISIAVKCDHCGFVKDVDVPLPRQRRHNRWGKGYHGSKDIKKLGSMHQLVLEVLEAMECFDYKSGMTSRRLWRLIESAMQNRGWLKLKHGEMKEINTFGMTYCTLNGVRARLSEMQGEGPFHLVASDTNTMNLEDEDEQKFRLEKGNRWFLRQKEGAGLLMVRA